MFQWYATSAGTYVLRLPSHVPMTAMTVQQICTSVWSEVQASSAIEDEVQNELMVLAIAEVQRAIAAQPAVPPPTAKPAAKPAGGKAKKDEPKPLQVRNTCLVHAINLCIAAATQRLLQSVFLICLCMN